jgi:lipoate-protein ligase A
MNTCIYSCTGCIYSCTACRGGGLNCRKVLTGLYLIDEPRIGSDNMGIDEALLERAARTQQPLLRIYRWSRPTLSLGYFQKYADRLGHGPSSEIDVVRRSTGGGAIVHHHDWTYALAIPIGLVESAARSRVGASQSLYASVHQAVVEWLESQGVQARTWSQGCEAPRGSCVTDNGSTSDDLLRKTSACSFLCFERRSVGDLVASFANAAFSATGSPRSQSPKLMGSAQRRIQGAVLQHGSLLLARSPHAPSLMGVQQIREKADLGLSGLSEFAFQIAQVVGRLQSEDLRLASSLDELLSDSDLPKKYARYCWVGAR